MQHGSLITWFNDSLCARVVEIPYVWKIFRVKPYEFSVYILHDIAAQIRLLFNHVTKEPCATVSVYCSEHGLIYEVRGSAVHGWQGICGEGGEGHCQPISTHVLSGIQHASNSMQCVERIHLSHYLIQLWLNNIWLTKKAVVDDKGRRKKQFLHLWSDH